MTHSSELKQQAERTAGVILTGFLSGKRLKQLLHHAKGFIMPSYHEGLPIALLEAISMGVPPIVSNITANLEVPLPQNCFFETGNIDQLSKNALVNTQEIDLADLQTAVIQIARDRYDWKQLRIKPL